MLVFGSFGVSAILGLVLILAGLSKLYLFPGTKFLGLFGVYIPSRLTYWIAPEGGLDAAFAIVLVASIVLWTALILTVGYLVVRFTHTRA